VNSDGLSISIRNTADTPCSLGADLEGQTYDHSSLSQQFYLGENGHIASALCPGLVIASTETGNPSLQTHLRDNDGAKWKLKNDGNIESMKFQTFLSIEGSTEAKVVLSELHQTWTVENVVAGSELNPNQGWITDWFVSFTEPGYNTIDLQQVSDNVFDGVTTCYPLNSGFNGPFERFASSFAITNAEDEETCAQAREELGFEGNHPFDTEVCERWEITY
jgi:hypothetical protein